jgi:K+-sensing histidine kinase KdpD
MTEAAVSNQDIAQLAEVFLKGLANMADAPAALVYLGDARLAPSLFFHVGLAPEAAPVAQEACAEEFCRLSPERSLPGPLHLAHAPLPPFTLFPLKSKQSPLGLVGLAKDEASLSAQAALVQRLLAILSQALNNLLDRLDYEKQIKNLNVYLSVSAMIAQTLDLRDVLEAVLYFCLDMVAAEAASVLLLDYEKKNFRFYSAEGPAKPVLLMATFPADQGLAGAVLAAQQPEIINDVQSDPRFYGKFDADSGFLTRNMIAIPLTAGEEKIGVLEIINKIDGPFTDDDLLFLQTIAEEIAFAIRNAKLFEVVVKSYCKQRQGLNTCKGCKRPLGSWTPCVRYREEAGLLEV